jgi:hypothetical protein
MFHPLLSKKLKKSLHLIGRVSIILVSPESPINILLEELIIKNLDLDLILDYSENDFDIHYELDVVNMRSLKRRLFSVLPEAVRRIQNLTPPSPELRAEIRKEIQQQTGLTIGGIEQSFFKYKE